jgi:hypothetical protein
MSEKTEQLLDLLEDSTLDYQLKEDKIVQILQYEEDIIEAKMLTKKILRGNFKSVKEKSIDDLIDAFTKENILEDALEKSGLDKEPSKSADENNEEYIKLLKSQLELLEYKSHEEIKKLKDENEKLTKMLKQRDPSK